MFSGLPPEADIDRGGRHVLKGPQAEIDHRIMSGKQSTSVLDSSCSGLARGIGVAR
jgi:hypothetical protein